MNNFNQLDKQAAALVNLISGCEAMLDELNSMYQTTGERYLDEKARLYKELAQHTAQLIQVEAELDKYYPKEEPEDKWVNFFGERPVNDPSYAYLVRQVRDIASYMNDLEMISDLWTEKDDVLYHFLDIQRAQLNEEIHFLQMNEFF